MIRLAAVLSLLLCLAKARLCAQETAEPEPQKDPRWQEFYRGEAAAWQFTTAGDSPEKLEFQTQPVMEWVSLNDYNGHVFVWTRKGRPEVVGTIFSFPGGRPDRRNMVHEFHSFSETPIEASGRDGQAFAFTGAAELKPIPGAPPPAENAARRRLQLRALAREFSAHMKRQDQRWELRLLNQPLYSFDAPSETVLGGAVFAFVGFVTDPEILLLIEARQTDRGPEWFYAAARFSNKSLWLEHRQKEVWSYLEDPRTTEGIYFLTPAKTVVLPAD